MHQNGIPIWRLLTKLYKGAWNVSANNWETVGHKGLRKIVYILVFYNISFSWPFPQDGFQFIFFVAWQWKRSINIKYAKEGFIRCKDCGAITKNVIFKLRTLQNEKWADKNSLYCSYNKQLTISKCHAGQIHVCRLPQTRCLISPISYSTRRTRWWLISLLSNRCVF